MVLDFGSAQSAWTTHSQRRLGDFASSNSTSATLSQRLGDFASRNSTSTPLSQRGLGSVSLD